MNLNIEVRSDVKSLSREEVRKLDGRFFEDWKNGQIFTVKVLRRDYYKLKCLRFDKDPTTKTIFNVGDVLQIREDFKSNETQAYSRKHFKKGETIEVVST